jgi:hypothetical protein
MSASDITEAQLAAFQSWMSLKEKITHDLATKMLGTSYVPKKTHLYKKYLDSLNEQQKLKAPASKREAN